MNRRKFGALIGVATAAHFVNVPARSEDADDWRYLGSWDATMTMFAEATERASREGSTIEETAFALYGLSAIAQAGHTFLVKLTPPASVEETHRISLDALAAMADASDEIRAAISEAAYRSAVTVGMEAAIESMDIVAQWSTVDSPTPVPTQALPKPTSSPTSPRPASSGVTMANFNRLREGMSYSEVVAILGSRGELISSSTIAGITTEMYMWEGNALGANMNAMFQDGKLISKAQFGLD